MKNGKRPTALYRKYGILLSGMGLVSISALSNDVLL